MLYKLNRESVDGQIPAGALKEFLGLRRSPDYWFKNLDNLHVERGATVDGVYVRVTEKFEDIIGDVRDITVSIEGDDKKAQEMYERLRERFPVFKEDTTAPALS